jgi:hypothetical protein
MYSSPRIATRRPRSPQPAAAVPDWSKLSRGDVVRVFRRDGSTASGLIDMLALDRSVLWVIQDGGRGRVMICCADRPRVVVVTPAEKSC